MLTLILFSKVIGTSSKLRYHKGSASTSISEGTGEYIQLIIVIQIQQVSRMGKLEDHYSDMQAIVYAGGWKL